jgi:hypothetical protein
LSYRLKDTSVVEVVVNNIAGVEGVSSKRTTNLQSTYGFFNENQ